jgi:hypothetical protein
MLVYACTTMSAVACRPLSSFAECECVMAFLAALANDSKTYGFGNVITNEVEHVSLLSVSEADEHHSKHYDG